MRETQNIHDQGPEAGINPVIELYLLPIHKVKVTLIVSFHDCVDVRGKL